MRRQVMLQLREHIKPTCRTAGVLVTAPACLLLSQSSSMSTSPPGSVSCSALLKAAILGARGCCPAGGRERASRTGAAGASAASPCSRICMRLPACAPRRALLCPLAAALLHTKALQRRVAEKILGNPGSTCSC